MTLTNNNSLFKVTLYDDEIYPFDGLSNCEIESLINCIDNLFDTTKVKMQFPYMVNDEEQTTYGMILNMDDEKMEKYINKKILIKPQQYGASPWGNKIEFLFEKYNLDDKVDTDKVDPVEELTLEISNLNLGPIEKKQIKCSKCGIQGHNKRSCKK